jgi:5'/3'-nucleotidase SurE
MSEIGRVMVVAPAAGASGSGTMVTYRRDLQVQEVPERLPGVKAYMVDGTPADCVLIGLRRLKQGWISLVTAGINPGANLGADLFLSGTCGAALMAAFRKITAIAVSLDLEPASDGGIRTPRWETAEAVTRTLARGVVDGAVPDGAFLSANIPARPLDEVQGVQITWPSEATASQSGSSARSRPTYGTPTPAPISALWSTATYRSHPSTRPSRTRSTRAISRLRPARCSPASRGRKAAYGGAVSP